MLKDLKPPTRQTILSSFSQTLKCFFFCFLEEKEEHPFTGLSCLFCHFIHFSSQIGDRIVNICGTSAEGMSHSQAVSLLKNAMGTIHLQVSQTTHTHTHKSDDFLTTFVFLTNKAADSEIICCRLFILSVGDEQQITLKLHKPGSPRPPRPTRYQPFYLDSKQCGFVCCTCEHTCRW